MLKLQQLILEGNVEAALQYIINHPNEINSRDAIGGLTPLEAAAQEGYLTVLIALLNHPHFILSSELIGHNIENNDLNDVENDVNEPEETYNDDISLAPIQHQNALDLANQCPHISCALLLEACGFKLNSARHAKLPPLTVDDVIALIYKTIKDDTTYLFNKIANYIDHQLLSSHLNRAMIPLPALFLFAIENGRLEIMQRLINLDATILTRFSHYEPLRHACAFEQVAIFSNLRARYTEDQFKQAWLACSVNERDFISELLPHETLVPLYQLLSKSKSVATSSSSKQVATDVDDNETNDYLYVIASQRNDRALKRFLGDDNNLLLPLLNRCLKLYDFSTYSYIRRLFPKDIVAKDHPRLNAILQFDYSDLHRFATELLESNQLAKLATFIELFYPEKALFWHLFAKKDVLHFSQYIFSLSATKTLIDVCYTPKDPLRLQQHFLTLAPAKQQEIRNCLIEFCKAHKELAISITKKSVTDKTPLLQNAAASSHQSSFSQEFLLRLFHIPSLIPMPYLVIGNNKSTSRVADVLNSDFGTKYLVEEITSYLLPKEKARLSTTCRFFNSIMSTNNVLFSAKEKIQKLLDELQRESHKKYRSAEQKKNIGELVGPTVCMGTLTAGLAIGNGIISARNATFAAKVLEFCSSCLNTSAGYPNAWSNCRAPGDLSIYASCRSVDYDCADTCDKIDERGAFATGISAGIFFIIFLITLGGLLRETCAKTDPNVFFDLAFKNLPDALKRRITAIFAENNIEDRLTDDVTVKNIQKELNMRLTNIDKLLIHTQQPKEKQQDSVKIDIDSHLTSSSSSSSSSTSSSSSSSFTLSSS